MKTAALSASLLGLALAGNVNNIPAAETGERQILEYYAQNFAQLEALANNADVPARRVPRRARVAGLDGATLTTSSLQPSSGLDSAARGLTPLADWQRMFPRKEQR